MQDKALTLLLFSIFGFLFAAICVGLRCYTRIYIVKSWGVDDLLMVLAFIFFTLNDAASVAAINYGLGQHVVDINPQHIPKLVQSLWFAFTPCFASIMFIKLSIGCFFLRVGGQTKSIRIITYAAMGITLISSVGAIVWACLLCRPISLYWDKNETGTCVEPAGMTLVTIIYGSVCLAVDIMLTILPIFVIWNLNMSWKAKVSLAPIVAMGLLASATVVIRYQYTNSWQDPDVFYSNASFGCWAEAEQFLGIVAGCCPPLYPLILVWKRKIWPKPEQSQYDASGNLEAGGRSVEKSRKKALHNSLTSSLATVTTMDDENDSNKKREIVV